MSLRRDLQVWQKSIRMMAACLLGLSFATTLVAAGQSAPSQSASAAPQTTQLPDGTMVYKVGPGVSPPKIIHQVDPGPPERERAPFDGTVLLRAIVDEKGKPREIKVQRSLKPYLDELAIDAVKQWRFKPASKDGKPVAVQIMIQINFHLY